MNDYTSLIQESEKSLSVADHIIFVTFPLVKDPKLLLAVIEELFKSLEKAMLSLLNYEYTYKRISTIGESFDARFYIFKSRVVPLYHFNNEVLIIFSDLKEILDWHSKSPVEFRKNNEYVICLSDYRMKTITINQLKGYIPVVKEFISRVKQIVMKNERIRR